MGVSSTFNPTSRVAAIFLLLTNLAMAAAHPSMKGAYYPSWAQSQFPPSSINTNLFTHIYYAFLSPDAASFEFHVDPSTQSQLLNFTSTLHAKRPPVKALYSIGGASDGPSVFSRMASTSASRVAFIRSSVLLARTYGFDGIDLDWEFPQDATDMHNFGLLLDEWRAEVNHDAAAENSPALLLTAAVYYSADAFLSGPQRAYPSASVGRNLDWVNVMNYDYRGSWDTSATGAHAALSDPTGSNLSTRFGLGTWIRAGVPRQKLVMGLPLYGRTWKLRDPAVHGIGAPAVGVGPGEGVLTFAQVVKFNLENRAVVVYDPATVSAYSVAGTSWIGYDDTTSVAVKVRYARALGLRGYFFWAVNGDYQWTISRTASLAWLSL